MSHFENYYAKARGSSHVCELATEWARRRRNGFPGLQSSQLTYLVPCVVMVLMVVPFGTAPSAPQKAWAESVTVTINPSPDGVGTGGYNAQRPEGSTGYPTYSYWVMMWASMGSDNRVSYYVDKADLATALDNLKVGNDDLFKVEAAGTDHWNVTINKKSDDTAFTGEEVANALNGMTKKDALAEEKGTASVQGEGNKASFTLTKNGYVLVTSTLGSNLVLDTYGNKEIDEKNVYPSSIKTQSGTESGTYSSNDLSREVGNTVYYHIDITIPATATKAIEVYDTISKGLTLNTNITPKATYGTPMSSLSWTKDTGTTGSNDNKTYTATIPENTVKALANAASNAGQTYTTLTLSYTAEVNGQAVDFDTSTHESNSSHIKYGSFETKNSTVDVYTYKFQLLKYDAATLEAGGDATAATPLGGAEFELYRQGETTPVSLVPVGKDNNPTKFRVAASPTEVGAVTRFTTVSGAGNTIQISGLDNTKTYQLKETQAPEGYNRLTEDVTIPTDIIKIGGILSVENHQGAVMPSTGGPGTVWLYVVGGVLVVAAGVALIARRRMRQH